MLTKDMLYVGMQLKCIDIGSSSILRLNNVYTLCNFDDKYLYIEPKNNSVTYNYLYCKFDIALSEIRKRKLNKLNSI